jgi:hypothetical protein
LVVAAKSLGIQAEVFQRILLFLNPVIGQSAHRLYELSRLFDELDPAAAERMLSIWRSTVRAIRSMHRYIGMTSGLAHATPRNQRHIASPESARGPARFKSNER